MRHDGKKKRYDIPPYTVGWFQLGWSDDLHVNDVRKIRQFGREYTLFRGADGQLGLIDDICPHLGAHFSNGGRIEGNAVRAAFFRGLARAFVGRALPVQLSTSTVQPTRTKAWWW